MDLTLGAHSQGRMPEREVNMDHVKAAIKNPDMKYTQPDGSTVVTKDFGERRIAVVYCRSGFRDRKNEVFIKTFYYIK